MGSNKVLAFENSHYRYYSRFEKDVEKRDFSKDMVALKKKMIKNATQRLGVSNFLV